MGNSTRPHEQRQSISVFAAAQTYTRRGWCVLPVAYRGKMPTAGEGWQQLRLTEADLPSQFRGRSNIGVLLGAPSGGLVDIDLDHQLAVEMAPQFLPATPAVFGRSGKLRSHWLFRTSGPVETKRLASKAAGTIVEIRSTGSQTVFPPSVHESGEPIEWEPAAGEPADVDAEELLACVERLAAAVRARLGEGEQQPTRLPTVTPVGQCGGSDIERRALAYLDKMPAGISGQLGHNPTYAAAVAMVHGFGLSPERALTLLLDHYNPRCEPPWSEKELEHKVTDAAEKQHSKPYGWLRDQKPDELREPGSGFANSQLAKNANPLPLPVGDVPDDVPDWVPFPVDSLPEPLAGYVRLTADAVGCDESLLAAPLLVQCAAAVGNARRVQLKPGWTEPAILWCAIVAESGGHKSPALERGFESLDKVQRREMRKYEQAMEDYKAELASHKASQKSKKGNATPPPEPPVATRYITTDSTIESLALLLKHNDRGLVLKCDELSGWLGSFGRYSKNAGALAEAGKWLELFGGRSLIIDRKTSTPPTIYVPRASCSVIGGIQPAILSQLLTQDFENNGLCARLLTLNPPRRKQVWSERGIPKAARDEMDSLIDRLLALEMSQPEIDVLSDDDWKPEEPEPVDLVLSPEAKRLWVSFFNQHCDEQYSMSGGLAARWQKLLGYAGRFALVCYSVRSVAAGGDATGPIDPESMQAGIDLARWFGRESQRCLSIRSESDDDRELRLLKEWIAGRGGTVSVRDVQAGPRKYRKSSADDVERLLTELVNRGAGSWGWTDSPTKRAEVFVLNNGSSGSGSGFNENTAEYSNPLPLPGSGGWKPTMAPKPIDAETMAGLGEWGE